MFAGGGTNALVGPAVASTWNLTGSGAGDVNGTPFTGITNITGGSANDVLTLSPTASLAGTVNLAAGDNTVSYASWTSDVQVDTSKNTATALGSLNGSYVTTLIGGSGHDTLVASNSRAMVLVGGAGNDVLTSGSQRSILLGGDGSDTLLGGSGENLLIAATTSHDNNLAALSALLNEWKSSVAYSLRVAHLRGTTSGGLNGSFLLSNSPSDTLFDDALLDTLTGNSAQDWFLASTSDLLTDRILTGTTAELWDDVNG
jgi:Ca2+-binding RTX toxin-like protein